jgi:haloalkane dehalogenase
MEWLDKSEYPFKSNFFTINGQRLHYIDEGKGEVILFVHGTPSWSFDFRNVIKQLIDKYRCIAVDHIGFGLSDKPKEYDYTTPNHSKTLNRFINYLDLRDFTMVVHDFGGPIGLGCAIENPSLVKRFVILNSWLWSIKDEPDFISISRILKSPLLPFLYRFLNFSPRFILPSSFGDKKLSKGTLKQYTKPFRNKDERNGTVAFAKSLLNDQDWFESLWNKKHVIDSKPTLLIWGMKDKFVTQKYLEKFSAGFPNATLKILDSCGHFPQEEQSEKVVQFIAQFINTN